MSAQPRPLGFQITSTWCRTCAPEGITESYAPLREGDDHGVPYDCDICGKPLLPCEHEWSKWHPWYEGGSWRYCTKDACEEIERSDREAAA